MKTKVFYGTTKDGARNYWYISGKNYKDANDKITYYVNFTKDCGEPKPIQATSKGGLTYNYAEIDVLEMSFGCFNGKPQLSIFKFVESQPKNSGNPNPKFNGAKINTDDLPF